MIETFGEKYSEVEKHYESQHPPTGVVIAAAVLVERLLLHLFKSFFLSLKTEEDRRQYIDFERRTRKKHPSFPDKIMLGQAIGAYLDLCRTFSDHPWLETSLKDDINRLNRLRIKAVHPEQGKTDEKDALDALKAAKKILKKTGFKDREAAPLGFPLGAYLRYRLIKDDLETAADETAYARIIRNADDLIPTLLTALAHRLYPDLNPEEKEAALPLIDTESPADPFYKLDLFKRLPDGQNLKQRLADIDDSQDDAPSRAIAADHVHLLDQLFTPFLDPETENRLEFANHVRLLYSENRKIRRADRQRLQGIAQDRGIPDPVADSIQKTVVDFLKKEGIEPVFEPEPDAETPPELPKPRKKRWIRFVLAGAALLLIASVAIILLFPNWKVIQPANRFIRQTLLSISPPDTWEDPTTGMRFIYVSGGSYQMGCDGSDNACTPYEQPMHDVELDDFWIAETEVTQGQWQKIMNENPAAFQDCGDDCPVEMVSWKDAQGFIEKLNEKSQNRFRLPTEAEWEYACQTGGMDTPYAGGDRGDAADLAWYADNSGGRPHPVAQKAPNELGLYDMSGNVWEWCRDAYSDTAYDRHAARNPVIESGTERVIRGGAWDYPLSDIRCGFRAGRPPDRRTRNIGLRLVRETDPS